MSSEQTYDIDFEDLKPVHFSVRYKGKEYVLTEASGGAAMAYRNHLMKSMKLQDGKPVGMDGSADAELILVQQCLFEMVDQPDGTKQAGPVALGFVRKMPYQVVKRLFDRVKAVSQIDDPDTEDALNKQIASLQKRLEELKAQGKGEPLGNDSLPGTTDGSD